jgi:hypothetical protein
MQNLNTQNPARRGHPQRSRPWARLLAGIDAVDQNGRSWIGADRSAKSLVDSPHVQEVDDDGSGGRGIGATRRGQQFNTHTALPRLIACCSFGGPATKLTWRPADPLSSRPVLASPKKGHHSETTWVPLGSNARLSDNDGDTLLFVGHRGPDPINSDNTIDVFLEERMPPGTWTVRLHAVQVGSGGQRVPRMDRAQ